MSVHQGKRKTETKTDEYMHPCKYTTKCTHMLNQTGESMVSISSKEVPPPRKLRTDVRKYENDSLLRHQLPDLCNNNQRRNDSHSGMRAPADRPSHQQKAKVDAEDPSSRPDIIITPSTCVSPSDDAQSMPGDDTHVSAVIDQPQGVREEEISRLSTHVTTSIAHTAMKTSKTPIVTTNTTLGESSQPDHISKLSEFNRHNEVSHEHDKKSVAWLVYIIISFIYIHRLLIYVGTICLYTATWMLTMLKSKKKSGARSLRRFKPSMHAKSSKSKQSKSLADHVTPGKICTSCLHICYIASAILFCACLVKYIPEKNLLVSARQDYMLYIQERNLTRSSPFDTMAAKQDRSLTPLVHSTSHTQERNHRDHRSKSMMQKIRAWNTDSTRNKLSFIQQSAIQDIESSMLHHPQHPVTKLVKLKSEYC